MLSMSTAVVNEDAAENVQTSSLPPHSTAPPSVNTTPLGEHEDSLTTPPPPHLLQTQSRLLHNHPSIINTKNNNTSGAAEQTESSNGKDHERHAVNSKIDEATFYDALQNEMELPRTPSTDEVDDKNDNDHADGTDNFEHDDDMIAMDMNAISPISMISDQNNISSSSFSLFHFIEAMKKQQAETIASTTDVVMTMMMNDAATTTNTNNMNDVSLDEVTTSTTTTARADAMHTTMANAVAAAAAEAEMEEYADATSNTPIAQAKAAFDITNSTEEVSDDAAAVETTTITVAAADTAQEDNDVKNNSPRSHEDTNTLQSQENVSSAVANAATLVQEEQHDQQPQLVPTETVENPEHELCLDVKSTTNHPILSINLAAAESYDASDEMESPNGPNSDDDDDDDDDETSTITDASATTTSGTEDNTSGTEDNAIAVAATEKDVEHAPGSGGDDGDGDIVAAGSDRSSGEQETQQTATTETETTASIAAQDESSSMPEQDKNESPDRHNKEKDGLKMPFIYYSPNHLNDEEDSSGSNTDADDEHNEKKDKKQGTSSSSSSSGDEDDSRGSLNIMDDSSLSSRESFAEHERKQRGMYSILIPYGGGADYSDYSDVSVTKNNHHNQEENKSSTTPDLDPIELEQQQKQKAHMDGDAVATSSSLAAKQQQKEKEEQQQQAREQSNVNIATAIIMIAIVAIVIWLIVVIIGKADNRNSNGGMNGNNNDDDSLPVTSGMPNARNTFPPSTSPSFDGPLPLPWNISCPLDQTTTTTTAALVSNGTINNNDCGHVECAISVCQADASCCLNNTLQNVSWDESCVARACNDPSCGTCPLKHTGTTCSEVSNLGIDIKLDQYPEETTWKVSRVDTGSIIAVGGPYGGMPGRNISETVTDLCLDGCYAFTLYDSSDDGICCLYGDGDYNIMFDGESLLPTTSNNGEFNVTSKTTYFGGGC